MDIKRIKLILAGLFIAAGLGSAVLSAQVDGDTAGQDLKERMQKKVSVQFRKTLIDDVIRILAEQADVDIVKSPTITGDVTVTLTDVPLEEALNNILSVHGCTYILTENMVRVISKIEQVEQAEPMRSETYEIAYADVEQVVKALKDFTSQQGSISHIEGTNFVLVRDTESKIRDITSLVEKIDRATPQIEVEARIYDVTCQDKLDLGFAWQVGRNNGLTSSNIANIDSSPTSRTDPFATGMFNSPTDKSTGTAALRLGWLNSGIDIDLVLKAQQNIISAKLLANPRILVLDNVEASINIISEIPYQELTETDGGASMGTTSFKNVGVALVVTPHVTRNNLIRLDIEPSFSVKVGDVQFQSAGLQYPQPIIDKREAKTTLLIKDGQTVVLGGLRKKEVTKQINKVPVLGDLPLFGKMFRSKGEDTKNSELVVFITPWIVGQQPPMTEDERRAYEETNFKGPTPATTKAERKAQKD